MNDQHEVPATAATTYQQGKDSVLRASHWSDGVGPEPTPLLSSNGPPMLIETISLMHALSARPEGPLSIPNTTKDRATRRPRSSFHDSSKVSATGNPLPAFAEGYAA